MLQAARRRGLRTAVLAADRVLYGHVYDDLVDAWLVTDTSDARAASTAITALDGEVAAVTSSVDSFVRVAARVARRRGLRGPDPEGAGIGRDKARARQALADADIPDIRWATLPARLEDIASPIGYPCVVKPVDGVASWDVALVTSDQEVQSLARRHLRREYGRNVRPRRRLLFEEFFDGPLYSAEGFTGPDGVRILGYSDRVMSPPPHFIELAVRFASTPPFPDARAFVESCLKALGYDFGAFHLEFILTPAGPGWSSLTPGSSAQGYSRPSATSPASFRRNWWSRTPSAHRCRPSTTPEQSPSSGLPGPPPGC